MPVSLNLHSDLHVNCHLSAGHSLRAPFFHLTAICSIDANPQSRSRRRHVSSMPKSPLHYANGCPLFRVRVMTVPSVYCDIIDAPTPPHKLTFWVKLIGLVPVRHSQSAQLLNWHKQRHRPLIDGLCIRLQIIQQERLNLLHLITLFIIKVAILHSIGISY